MKENIDANFSQLEKHGLKTLADFDDRLKTKKKIKEFSIKTGLSENYLTILKREGNSYTGRPTPVSDIPVHHLDALEKLIDSGIKRTDKLFELAAKEKDSQVLSEKLNIHPGHLLEIVQLADLLRITGAGPVFARTRYTIDRSIFIHAS